jgi:hypothetical protein
MTSTEKERKKKRKKMFRGTKIRQNCDGKTQNINQNSDKNISLKNLKENFVLSNMKSNTSTVVEFSVQIYFSFL